MADPGRSVATGTAPQRLIVASNREPFRIVTDGNGETSRCVTTVGGLVSGLLPVVERFNALWICWDPQPRTAIRSVATRQLKLNGASFPLLQVGLRKQEVQGYYNGFCNQVLWPICHEMPDRSSPRLDYWRHFRTINELFAETIAGQTGPNDILWLHDYHLMLVPAALRLRTKMRQPIAYFHHIPFPNAEVFGTLPWHRQLLEGLLGADVVGFHTSDYAAGFIESCAKLLGSDTDTEPGTVIHGRHRTRVRVRPIGVNTRRFERLARHADIQREALRIRRELACDCLILSVDRLDYTKGLQERVQVIQTLFSRIPQLKEIVTFMQVAVPTRAGIPGCRQYRARYESAVRDLNQRFGTDDWRPLISINTPLNRRELVARYLAADIACVTPLADGMNLVAFEYCATRIGNEGILVLSQQAGAVSLLGEFAVTVNGHDTDSVVAGLVRALTMPSEQRARRMKALRAIVARVTSDAWAERCLGDLQTADSKDVNRVMSN